MKPWTFRKAEPCDADAMSTCVDAAYARYVARIPDLPPMAAGCAEDIAQSQTWVAEIADVIVGGLVLAPRDGFMLLANVAVQPDHHGAGLGRALMTLAETEAREQGYREMRLNTHAGMLENVQLYRHLGWEEVGRYANRVAMRKML